MKKSGFKSLLKKIRPYAVPGIITGLVMIVILILKGCLLYTSRCV